MFLNCMQCSWSMANRKLLSHWRWNCLHIGCNTWRSAVSGVRFLWTVHATHFHFFIFHLFFILVYFSAHGFIIVNILRQLKHDAGGFSYKSTRTLLELFPLIILVVNVKLNTHKNINHDTVTNSKIWLTKRGIPSTIQTSQPPRKKIKRWGMKKGKVMKK